MSLFIQHKQDILSEISKLLATKDLKAFCSVSKAFRDSGVRELFKVVPYRACTKLLSRVPTGVEYYRFVRQITFDKESTMLDIAPLFNSTNAPLVETLRVVSTPGLPSIHLPTRTIKKAVTCGIYRKLDQTYVDLERFSLPGYNVCRSVSLVEHPFGYLSLSTPRTSLVETYLLETFLDRCQPCHSRCPINHDHFYLDLILFSRLSLRSSAILRLRKHKTLRSVNIPQPRGLTVQTLTQFLAANFVNMRFTFGNSVTTTRLSVSDLPELLPHVLQATESSRFSHIEVSLSLNQISATKLQDCVSDSSFRIGKKKVRPVAIINLTLVSNMASNPIQVEEWLKMMARGIYKMVGGHIRDFKRCVNFDYAGISRCVSKEFSANLCKLWVETEWMKLKEAQDILALEKSSAGRADGS